MPGHDSSSRRDTQNSKTTQLNPQEVRAEKQKERLKKQEQKIENLERRKKIIENRDKIVTLKTENENSESSSPIKSLTRYLLNKRPGSTTINAGITASTLLGFVLLLTSNNIKQKISFSLLFTFGCYILYKRVAPSLKKSSDNANEKVNSLHSKCEETLDKVQEATQKIEQEITKKVKEVDPIVDVNICRLM